MVPTPGGLPAATVTRLTAAWTEEQETRSRRDLKTLRRLSHTEAHFELSGGKLRRARGACARSAARRPGIGSPRAWRPEEQRTFQGLAPALALIPGVASRPARDRQLLRRFVAA